MQERIWDNLRVECNQSAVTAETSTQVTTPPNNGVQAASPAPAQEPDPRPVLRIPEQPPSWRDTANRSNDPAFSGRHWNQRRGGRGRRQGHANNHAAGVAERGPRRPPTNSASRRQSVGCSHHCTPPPPPPCYSPPFLRFPWPPHCWLPPPPPWMRGIPPPRPPCAMQPWRVKSRP